MGSTKMDTQQPAAPTTRAERDVLRRRRFEAEQHQDLSPWPAYARNRYLIAAAGLAPRLCADVDRLTAALVEERARRVYVQQGNSMLRWSPDSELANLCRAEARRQLVAEGVIAEEDTP